MIADIVRAPFGGFLQIFEHHVWRERGSDMMRKVQARVRKNTAAFAPSKRNTGMTHDGDQAKACGKR